MIILQYIFLLVLAVLVPVSTIPFVLSAGTDNPDQINTGYVVPNWIKNTAGWWADGQINDNSFVTGIQWMISESVIILPPTEQGTSDGENIIPNWVKKTAGWWAEDKIHAVTFVAAIKYLIVEGIIIIEQETEEVEESVEEITEIKEFDMIVNHQSCSHCTNWASVGEEYHFQIETFDEFRGSLIDGVTITVKIISKDGELRHDFGVVTTENGIYNDSITIPNMDWYGENTLSITAEYNGVEKTIEKEFEVFHDNSGTNTVTMAGAGDCALVSPVSVFDLNAADGKPQGIEFSSDGTKMFTTGNPSTADSVWYYKLDGPYCIATATYVNALNVESRDNTPTGVAFNPTGSKMYVTGKGSDVVLQYDLSTPFIVTSASFSYALSTTEANGPHASASVDNAPEDIHFNDAGTQMFIVGSQTGQVHQYSFLGSPFTLSNATHTYSLTITDEESSPAGITFNPTGTKMFIVGNNGKEVNQYTLSTPFVLSTASHDYAFSVSGQESNARGIAFDSSGKKMFIIGFAGDDVNVYKLSTPFVLSSASFVS